MSTREAKARSFKEALRWTKTWRTTRCIFELNAKSVVDAVQRPPKNSIVHSIIEECVEILINFEEVLVNSDQRSANNVAYVLVQTAYSKTGLMEWYHNAPDFICNLIDEES